MRIDVYKRQEYIRLVRNDNYWGEAGFYETLEFTWVNDSTSRTMAVASGDADFAVEIGSADLTAVESYDNCIGIMLGGGGTNVLFFNVTNEYLSNELVREAIFYAIDATACNMVGTNGTSLIADSVIASSVPSVSYTHLDVYKRQRKPLFYGGVGALCAPKWPMFFWQKPLFCEDWVHHVTPGIE